MACAIVMVHGGQHTKHCWDPTVAAIHAINPAVQVLAVNLPGHGDQPGDLATLTVEQCAQSVVDQIQAAGMQRVLLVGHSMAGITLPKVAEKLGANIVQKMLFVACCIPPNGGTVFGTLQQPMRFIAGVLARNVRVSPPLSPRIAKWIFANGATPQQQAQMVACLCPESATIVHERIDRSRMPAVAKAWVLTLRDRALRPKLQRRFIDNLGGVDEIIELDTSHDAMISEPEKLARIILASI